MLDEAEDDVPDDEDHDEDDEGCHGAREQLVPAALIGRELEGLTGCDAVVHDPQTARAPDATGSCSGSLAR